MTPFSLLVDLSDTAEEHTLAAPLTAVVDVDDLEDCLIEVIDSDVCRFSKNLAMQCKHILRFQRLKSSDASSVLMMVFNRHF